MKVDVSVAYDLETFSKGLSLSLSVPRGFENMSVTEAHAFAENKVKEELLKLFNIKITITNETNNK